jgi:hypothetical protein
MGAACAAVLLVATSAHAQLALSYKLDVHTERSQQPEISVNRCAGFNWVTSIGACGREVLTRITQSTRSQNSATYEPAAAPASGELPDLGAPERVPRFLRSGGGREALLASSKTADLLLRFGSKYRLRTNDEGGWDYYRFSDTTYENHIKTRGHKAVGVELLVPFQ